MGANMKFPLHVIRWDSSLSPGFLILDGDHKHVITATSEALANEIIAGLTLLHQPIPVMLKTFPCNQGGVGAIPARDISYRQRLIEQALIGTNILERDNMNGATIARRILDTVDELLKQMEEEG